MPLVVPVLELILALAVVILHCCHHSPKSACCSGAAAWIETGVLYAVKLLGLLGGVYSDLLPGTNCFC